MNNRLQRMSALIRKEFIQIRRDPSSLLIAFVLPVILLFFFAQKTFIQGITMTGIKVKNALN